MRSLKFANEFVGMDKDFAQRLYAAFLRRIENMSFEEAERELPWAAFDRYKQIYPERCPKEKIDCGNKIKGAKSSDSFQPGLFDK